ncbi:MAG: hypothetical protein LBS89_07530, partial [Zoogloeaceae bacterium]|nr:hypothetical protein [Zoogloeaceae bacterium]
VAILPRPIPVLKPLHIRLALAGATAKRVQVNFSGVEMDMGFNQITLQKGETGEFTGLGNLPVCVSGKMRWQATITLEDPAGTFAIPLQFATGI